MKTLNELHSKKEKKSIVEKKSEERKLKKTKVRDGEAGRTRWRWGGGV